MVGASGEGSNTVSLKRQRSSGDGTISSAIIDLNILDCPICFELLTIPIFQCDNGHLACSTCCPKLRNKCPQCAFPIGHNRNKAMERVVESVFIPCPNANFGCKQNVTYGKVTSHEKECVFSQCSCPVQDCNYTGSYKDLYDHYASIHDMEEDISNWFYCGGGSFTQRMNINSVLVKMELEEELLFVLQCIRESYGVYVTIRCIAPSAAPEVGEYSCLLSYSIDGQILTSESSKVKKIKKVSVDIPQDNFMCIPHNLLRGESLELKICIEKVKKI